METGRSMKKNNPALVFAIALSGSALLIAQGGASSTTAQTAQSNQAQTGMITVTGCLQRSEMKTDASPNSPQPTTVDAAKAGSNYILTNVPLSGATSTSPATRPGSTSTGGKSGSNPAPGTTATSDPGANVERGTTSGTDAGRSYTLIEKNSGELAPHVGHQIEVTGTIANASSGANTSATSSSNSSARGATGQRLQISSIRMISTTCPATTSTPR